MHSPWILGFEGPSPSSDFLGLLERVRPCSLILFQDNLPRGARDLPPLRRRLEEAAGQELFLFLDGEGGWIDPLRGKHHWPSPRAQYEAGLEAVEWLHRAMAREARSAGVDALIAPLADIDEGLVNPVIGSRSFGGQVEEVREAVLAAMRGLFAGGQLSVLKHFPGHGESVEDSHLLLPRVPANPLHLEPFRAGIEAGAPAIMTAHIRWGQDPRPATFRQDLLYDLLQKEMGFKGLLITDALEMGGCSSLEPEQRGLEALRAGCHLLTLARWTPGAECMIDELEKESARSKSVQLLREEATLRWEAFLECRPPASALPEEDPEPCIRGVRDSALYGDGRTCHSSDTFAIEFGSLGSWQQEDYLRELSSCSCRVLKKGEPLRSGEIFLYIGRETPSPERIDPARETLLVGPHGWAKDLESCRGSHDPSPRGVLHLLQGNMKEAGRERP
ncbi:MAG: glycoside hydrolase family 3 N-terminal domain-containing protein [Candidatus Krumholzibacteria bacterium]|nr:glycoside hydrolase family 3 N-terminal domain-containing protein [Candidatus Krumholzibacteria bacterium]MDP6668281.1 glycoside hydrolase family 3 N-terminal domain-containing protein [Candidatus Krumholzibacteria bacterium]MDP6797048.1 glycoside hydrolase family 3 N-terminal domain-containing protein [Candidatus Krumholzibacteria bacterium]MDP7022085.1 glycoside hydrolase family 3 N-terminal domain-containing protein [Candidatus Krumholzibacteria bacterium]